MDGLALRYFLLMPLFDAPLQLQYAVAASSPIIDFARTDAEMRERARCGVSRVSPAVRPEQEAKDDVLSRYGVMCPPPASRVIPCV